MPGTIESTGALVIYDRLVSEQDCNLLTSLLDAAIADNRAGPGRVTNEDGASVLVPDVLTSVDLELGASSNQLEAEANQRIHECYLRSAAVEYLSRFHGIRLSGCDLHSGNAILSRYPVRTGTFGLHRDSTHHAGYDRDVTIILYLNTVRMGGATVFPNQGVEVSPEQGSVLLFPSTWVYAHRATAPISNHKDVLVTFLSVEVGEQD